MALTLPRVLAAAAVLSLAPAAQAQTVPAPSTQATAQPLALSPECRSKRSSPATKRVLAGFAKAMATKRPVRILAIGSSSTVGLGASSRSASYPNQLEGNLETYFKGRDIEMISRGIPGEVAMGAAERLRSAVADLHPDLVLWQVGTNDALARIDIDEFAAVLEGTLAWLAEHHIDVVLIDPQYVEGLADDPYYVKIVDTIEQVANAARVPLVSRFDLMHDLAGQASNSAYLAKDHLHLNDLGYRCMAEYVATAIVSSARVSASPPSAVSQPPPNAATPSR